MKLTKSKLIKLTIQQLKELGYEEIKDTITGAQGLFIKKVEKEMYLTLGLTISRYYDCKFTASYYFSKVTTWGAIWGDIPKNSYERIGSFLTNEERKMLLDERYLKEGVKDSWWDLGDKDAVSYFLEAVEITEERFLKQPDLFYNIENSVDVTELVTLAKLVIKQVNDDTIDKLIYQFTPKKPVDDIPIAWFKAAEKVIIEEKGILNINTVKRLAADAYRQKIYGKNSD